MPLVLLRKDVIVEPHPESDHHHILITARVSPLTHAYRISSTSVNAFANYLADKPTHRHTHADTHG